MEYKPNEIESRIIDAAQIRFARRSEEHLRMRMLDYLDRHSQGFSERQRLFLLGFLEIAEGDACFGVIGGPSDADWTILRDDPAAGGESDPMLPDEPRLSASQKATKLLAEQIKPYDGIHRDYLCPSFRTEGGLTADFLWLRYMYELRHPRTGAPATGIGAFRERPVQQRPLVVLCGTDEDWRRKDREFQAEGFAVARFSGPELVNSPYACALEAERILGRFF